MLPDSGSSCRGVDYRNHRNTPLPAGRLQIIFRAPTLLSSWEFSVYAGNSRVSNVSTWLDEITRSCSGIWGIHFGIGPLSHQSSERDQTDLSQILDFYWSSPESRVVLELVSDDLARILREKLPNFLPVGFCTRRSFERTDRVANIDLFYTS